MNRSYSLRSLLIIFAFLSSCLLGFAQDQQFIAIDPQALQIDLSQIQTDKTGQIQKLSSALNQINSAYKRGESVSEFIDRIPLQSVGDRIVVTILPEQKGRASQVDESRLKQFGAVIQSKSRSSLRVEIPVGQLQNVAENVAGIGMISEPIKPHEDAITSEGVAAMNAESWHASGNYGNGVKVAVIDGGFINLSAAQTAGDIPSSYSAQDFTGSGLEAGTLHGTAVAEAVYDIAPQAELYLYRISDLTDFENAVDACIANGVHVVNHSMAWFNVGGYYNGTGLVCDIVDQGISAGLLWVNSAGNSALDHFRATFIDNGSGYHNFSGTGGNVNLIGPDPTHVYIHGPGEVIQIVMNWNNYPTTTEDYDLYLFRWNGSTWTQVASSTIKQSSSVAPEEYISYVNTITNGMYGIVVKRFSAATNVDFTLFSLGNGFGYHTEASSLADPASVSDVITVGAIDQLNYASGPQESFSSQGPTTDGRIKPDVAAPDNCNSFAYGYWLGTSLSSPHTAGICALIRSANPAFNAVDIRNYLYTSSVQDMGDPGKDNIYGWGKIQLPGPATITVTTPNGGETWQAGTNQNITWSSSGTSGNVRIEYSTNGGTDWTEITASAPDAGTYSWTVPNEAYANCRVRISDTDGNPVDESDGVFVILPAALMGEYQADGNTRGLWHMNEPGGTVAYDFSGNGNHGHYDNNPDIAAGIYGNCRILDEIADNVIIDNITSFQFGHQSFTVEAWIKCDFGNPANGIVNTDGYGLHINGNGTVVFMVTDANSSSFSVTSTSALNDGSWHHVAGVRNGDLISIFIDGLPESSFTLENEFELRSGGILDFVPWSDDTPYDFYIDEVRISDKARTPDEFNLNPGIRVITPNGGETWQAGTEQTIFWNSVGTSGNVTLEFSRNNGVGWATIEAGTPDDGSYSWSVPNEPCTECLIRIADTDGDPSDVSDGVFTILDQNIPVAANAYVGSMHNINNNSSENYGIELYVNVADPQGLETIASVVVTSPTGATYSLYDDGQNSDNGPNDGRYAVHIWNFSEAPPTGIYTFTILDNNGNSAVTTDVLSMVIDVPRNTLPLHNAVVNAAAPTFSWDGVSGAINYSIGVHDMQHNNVWSQNDINATSIVYNDNLSGSSLVEGQMYQWQVSTQIEDGRSWHEWSCFIYSTNANDPVAINPQVFSMHRGDDLGNEGYGIELYVNASDPQGPQDIASVTVVSPGGATYTLYDNGQNGDDEANNGRFGIHIWEFNQTPPPLGTYVFTVTDLGENTATASDVLDNTIDYPRNIHPANNEIISDANPIFTWDAVPGGSVYGVSVRDINNNHIWAGAASTNSITYNGPALTDGTAYRWNVGTSRVNDASSWHDDATFIYSSDPDKPIISYTQVYSIHDRFTNGSEQYRLELNADVLDPQGLTDITAVTVTSPGGDVYSLYDDGQHGDGGDGDGRYSNYNLPLTGAPAIGNYTFTATDGLGNTATILDPLQYFPMVPENMVPANGGFVSTPTPVYTWDAVPNATSYTIDVMDANNNNVWNRNNISTNSIQHNIDGTGTNLIEGHIYRWQLQAYTDEGRSWQEWLTFVYSADGTSPVAENPSVQSSHWGRDMQYDNYGLELRLNASDPQGLGTIVSVTVDAPGDVVYTLYDDGQHNDNGAHDGYFGNNIWGLPDAPLTGEYIFTVTDAQANTVTTSDILDNVIDIPRNIQPANNSLVNDPTPTFSWTAVAGASNYSVNVHDGTTQVWYRDNINTASVQYNDNGSGQALTDGRTYYWNISVRLDDAASWNDENCFVYSTNTNNPVAINPSVQSRHWGRDGQYDNYGLELRLNVMDPQGLGNIASVIVTAPGGTSYDLYDDGQHADNQSGDGYFGNNVWNLADPPVTGEYIFTVTNKQAYTAGTSDILSYVIDIPRNIQPANNSFITTSTPVISWNEVPGATNYWINVREGNTNVWSRGGITGTSVAYNDDATGQALQEGKTYFLHVNAGIDDAISWQDEVAFVYSSNPDNPIAANPMVQSMHRGNDSGDESYALEVYLDVMDPQGFADIASVTVTAPNSVVYILYDDGQHQDGQPNDGRYGNHIWEFNQTVPPFGEYVFTVTDHSGHTVSVSDNMNNVIDFPRNVHPVNNEVISTANPIFSWDAVPGVPDYGVSVRDINNFNIWSGNTTSNSVTYNYNGTGPSLTEGSVYTWNVGTATVGDARSWHDDVRFVYSSNPDNPIAGNPQVRSMHRGNDSGDESYALELYVDVMDPQGFTDIKSVTVTSPASGVYILYDDGQHQDGQPNDGRYGNHIWEFPQAPPLGEYVFTVTDNAEHVATASDMLDHVIDYPRNVQPVNNAVIISANPVFSWNAVPGVSSYWLTLFDINNNTIWNSDNITGTSVQYNDNGTGPALQEGVTYHWQVNTGLDDASSWHDWSYFTWSSDPDKPIVGDHGIWYRHYGDDVGNEYFYIELHAKVADPQGLGDIQSVTLTTPDLGVIALTQNTGDPGNYNGQWSSSQAPPLGAYVYTVTDNSGHFATAVDSLKQAQDFPRNIHPAKDAFVATATPTFSWDAVEGISGYSLIVMDLNNNQIWSKNNFIGTSVVYNDDGTGLALTEGSTYQWEIATWGDHCATWHIMSRFTYSSNTENPLISYANVYSMYHGNNADSEHPGIRLMADVADPQGFSDIQSVTVTSPDQVTYILYDDGAHGDIGPGDGRYSAYIWDLPQPAAPGEYIFRATDNSGHIASRTDILDYAIDYPRSIIPVNNGIMSPASPVFSWNPVQHAESYFIYVYESNGWDVVWWKYGITDTTVVYNDNGTGIPLTEGKSYLWEIFARGYDGQSWHEASPFIYRSNTTHTIHVDINNNSGTENGTPEYPYNTIQEGINASIGGDGILVHPGTYLENLNINNRNISLTSLYVNSADENNIANTIIDGNHAGTAILVQSCEVTIVGFTIRNGQASAYGAGGIQIENSSRANIHNCRIAQNNGIGQDEWGAGGITFNNGYLQIMNCVFTENYSIRGASALRAASGRIEILNSLFANNSGTMTFHYNDATGFIYNSTIAQNSHGLGFNNSPINLQNIIEWGNHSNCWGNPGSVSYSCTEYPYYGIGVIHTNPVFMNPYTGDFHLQQNSPCIDAGDPNPAYNDPDGTRNDMGYYGSPSGASYPYLDGPPTLNTITASPAYVSSGQVLTINASLFDAQTQVSSVSADIENPDETVIASVALYDDGAHSDNNAGDGVFGNTVTYAWLSGQHYFIDVTASDNNSHLATMDNVAGFDGINAPLMVDLPFTHELMSINGTGNESVWNTIAPVPVSKHHWGPIDSPADLSASYKACWNLDSLFILIDVTDDSLDNVHGVNPWENDKISLYLDMDNSRSSSYDADDWDMTIVWEGGFNPNRPFSGFNYAHHTNAARDGYQLEMALSLKDLGFPMADLLGFDLDIMDRDGEDPGTALLFWNSEINLNFNNPGLNGIARLMDYQENMPDQILKVLDFVDFPECGGSNAEIKVLLQNVGTALINEFDIAYSINGDTIYPAEKVTMQYLPGLAHQYTFTTHADLSVPGIYTFNIFTLLDNGDPHANFGMIAEKTVFGTDPVSGWTSYGTCNGLPDNGVRYVMEDSQGNIWAGTSTGGAARLDTASGTWSVFNSANSGFTNNNAITLFEDHENKIWVGLDGSDGVATTFNGTSWTSNNPSNNHVLTMFEDHADNMWFGTWGENGVRKWDRASDTWTIINTQNSGISSNDMWYGAIMEDDQNNMWFGTIGMNGPAGPGGLAKFDGNNWTVYNASNSGLPTNLIVGSLLDSKGNFWLAHGWENRGVTWFDGNNWMNYNTGNSGIAGNSVNSIFEDSSGNLWFATWGQGASRFDGRTWITFNTDNSALTSNNINSITEDSNKDIWFATANGLCKYDAPDQAIKVIDVVDFPNCGTTDAAITVRLLNTGSIPITQFDITYSINGVSISQPETAVLTLPPGDTVLYTFSARADLSVTGMYTLNVTTLLDGGNPAANQSYMTERTVFGTDPRVDWITYSTCNGLPSNNVRFVMSDSRKNIWIATGDKGVARLDTLTNTWTIYDMVNSGFSSNNAITLCEDHLGNIWAGFDGDEGIVSMYDGNTWTSNNQGNIHVLTIFEDHAGNMWFGTWDHGVRKWNRSADTWTTYTKENSGLPSNIMWYGAIMEDVDNNMWFAPLGFDGSNGLTKFDGTNWTSYNTSNSGAPSNTCWGAVMDSHGNIWMAHGWGTDGTYAAGVTRFDRVSTWTNFNTGNSGIVSDIMLSAFEDSKGNMWFGSLNNLGMSRFDGTNWENFTISNSGLTGNSVMCIAEDHKGNMWFGTNGLNEYLTGSNIQNEQSVPLTNGWNIFSLAVTPDDVSMMSILQPLISEGSLVKVQDETGAAIEQIPGLGTWIDNIHNWSNTEGYKIRVNTSTTLTVTGQPITQPVDISLLAGWNIIGYPSSNSQVAMTVLDELITAGSLMKVQSETGAAIEPLPLNMGWIDDIHNFMPGEGYKVRVASDDILTIDPLGSGGGLKSAPGVTMPRHFRPIWSGNGYDHMNIYLTEITEGASMLQAGDEIAVFDGDLCVGTTVIQHQNQNQNLFAVAVSADDPTTETRDGFTAGNEISFRIWRADANSEVIVNTVQFYPGYSNSFEPLGTTVAGVTLPAAGTTELVTALGDNYPNPFTQETTIPFTLAEESHVDLAIYDILGKRVATLVNSRLLPGSHTISWDGSNHNQEKVKPGIYFCRFSTNGAVMVKRIERIE